MKWTAHWHIKDAVDKSVEWSKCYLADGDIGQITKKQIKEYLTLRHGE